MDIAEYIGIDYKSKYTAEELNNILSKFNNLNMGDYYVDGTFAKLFSEQPISTVIKFIDMFKDINEFEMSCGFQCCYSLAGNTILMINNKSIYDKLYVYKIIDYLLKQDMNTAALCIEKSNGTMYDITYFHNKIGFVEEKNYDVIMYVQNNYNVIKNVRKIINNNDIILFDITDDLQFIELILLISKSRHRIVPKFVITHKILYWYLLIKNEIYNT